jgi:hypothetical protein
MHVETPCCKSFEKIKGNFYQTKILAATLADHFGMQTCHEGFIVTKINVPKELQALHVEVLKHTGQLGTA